MDNFVEGSVAITCDTGQSGCVIQLDGSKAYVLLKNNDLWHGLVKQLRQPQDEADLASCPLNVDRVEKPIIFRDRD